MRIQRVDKRQVRWQRARGLVLEVVSRGNHLTVRHRKDGLIVDPIVPSRWRHAVPDRSGHRATVALERA